MAALNATGSNYQLERVLLAKPELLPATALAEQEARSMGCPTPPCFFPFSGTVSTDFDYPGAK